MHLKWQSYDVWFLWYQAWQTEFFVILGRFLPFYPLTIQKIKILKKWKKMPEDIILLHMCSINDNHMMYGSWVIDHNQHNFLSFWTIFCAFIPLTTKKIKTLKKWKKPWRYYYFTQVYHKWQSSDVWFLRYEVWWTEFFVILDWFLPFYPSNNLKNQNFEKLKKTPGDITNLHKCTKNDDHLGSNLETKIASQKKSECSKENKKIACY